MKKLLAAAAAAAVALPVSALAADVRSRTTGSLMSPQPAFSWSGFYAGALLGGAQTRSKSTYTYDALVGPGVGFDNGAVRSTWFNEFASGTAPNGSGGTNIALTASSTCTPGSCTLFTTPTPGANSSATTSQRTNATVPVQVDSRNLVGALGGEIGYLTQSGALVLGLSLDGMFFADRNADQSSSAGAYSRNESLSNSASYTQTGALTNTATGNVTRDSNGSSQSSSSLLVSPKWLTTLRLSAGVAQDRFLAFASGGLAVGGVSSVISSSYTDSNSSICSGVSGGPFSTTSGAETATASVSYQCGSSAVNTNASSQTNTSARWGNSRNDIQYGYVIGGGLGFAVSSNIIAKLEGYYYDLGTVRSVVTGTAQQTTNSAAAANTGAASYTVRTKVDGVVGRAGVAYKF